MPSAANAKSEKPASSEALDNTPIRQIITIIEHKIRNLEKRKSKLTSYRDLQKAGKELHGDQKVAVAKYDEVAQTLEFARDLSKQVTGIVVSAEREAKKQAKREAWVRYAADSNKIREVLLILDCLMQMGNNEAREDFLNGTNGAVKLTEEDLKILDDLYPEVTPKHEINEEGQPGFHIQTVKAAEHLYAIIDGKPKEVLGTTYTHIKEIVTTVHECGYFDRTNQNDLAEAEENRIPTAEEELQEQVEDEVEAEVVSGYPGGVGVGVGVGSLPVPPAPAVVPAPAYPLRPLPPITLQEVEHAYFAQQYPQQRPIAEVIGSQNFFFLQESEIDSPICTPQPPQIPNQASPPGPIPSQTFTNHHFVQLPAGCLPDDQAMAHFQTDNGAYPGVVSLCPRMTLATALSSRAGPPPQRAALNPPPVAAAAAALPVVAALPVAAPAPAPAPATTAPEDKNDDEWKEGRSPEREEGADRRTQGQGDGQGRYRRYGRGPPRGAPNGHRGRGSFQSRQGGDGYRGRHGGDYQSRPGKDGYQSRQYDGYQSRQAKDGYQSRGGDDGYYGNGDTGESHQQQQSENGAGGRERYNDSTQNYQGGFKGRGRGGPRGGPRGASRPPRAHHYNRKPENVD